MEKQAANTLLMIEPIAFGFNEETAKNNYFQQKEDKAAQSIQELALKEFNSMSAKLRENGIKVIVVQDTKEPHTPDSIFPNNWVSFHADGRVVLYPMYARNRRFERRQDILDTIQKEGLIINQLIDYSSSENNNQFLEGTGSMILDRTNRIAYAALSERTDKELFFRFCKDMVYKPVAFYANQTVNGKRLPIYHTNVMMCVADRYAIVCLDTIDDEKEREEVVKSFESTEKEIIEISETQMYQFAGNMLQVENQKGEPFLVMSKSAYKSLNPAQIRRIESYNKILSMSIPTIEKEGGGSARCMLAEVFLPNK